MSKKAVNGQTPTVPSLPSRILRLTDAKTQLRDYVARSSIPLTCPTDLEKYRKYLLKRLYSNSILNWYRALDQNLTIRVISRNSKEENVGSDSDPVVVEISIPSIDDMYTILWDDALPDFVKQKIRKWVQTKNKDEIATEIVGFVKTALSLLPIQPVPPFFLNTVTALVIPPLVSYIVSKLLKESSSVGFISWFPPNKD